MLGSTSRTRGLIWQAVSLLISTTWVYRLLLNRGRQPGRVFRALPPHPLDTEACGQTAPEREMVRPWSILSMRPGTPILERVESNRAIVADESSASRSVEGSFATDEPQFHPAYLRCAVTVTEIIGYVD
jgi:hypothetical protein